MRKKTMFFLKGWSTETEHEFNRMLSRLPSLKRTYLLGIVGALVIWAISILASRLVWLADSSFIRIMLLSAIFYPTVSISMGYTKRLYLAVYVYLMMRNKGSWEEPDYDKMSRLFWLTEITAASSLILLIENGVQSWSIQNMILYGLALVILSVTMVKGVYDAVRYRSLLLIIDELIEEVEQ
jgi:hypothetical protein